MNGIFLEIEELLHDYSNKVYVSSITQVSIITSIFFVNKSNVFLNSKGQHFKKLRTSAKLRRVAVQTNTSSFVVLVVLGKLNGIASKIVQDISIISLTCPSSKMV